MDNRLHWDDINVGDEGQTLEYVISDELIDRYADVTGDRHEWYMNRSPFGVRVAHNTINALDYFAIMVLKWQREWDGLHARQETEVSAPLKVGQKVRVVGKFIEKYEKRGRKYFTLEYITTDENGSEILRNRLINVIND